MTQGGIVTAPSSATAGVECAAHVLVSGSYGGEYNAYHAGKWGLRGVVLNDAGVGRNGAGIRGLSYLGRIGLPAATADANTCHIGDGDHMLEVGLISHVNEPATRLGCRAGMTVRECAGRMAEAAPVRAPMPPISGGTRSVIFDSPASARVVALDAAPMLTAEDAGSIAVTGSHAALFRGRPDDVIRIELRAIFFSDAGIGLDSAGVSRLAVLDARGMPAACASADSAEIGNARSIYAEGLLSCANRSAEGLGAHRGMPVRDFIDSLRRRWSTS
jgi:hypothetical protein